MSWFDRTADWVADRVASVWFFTFCVLTVLVWLPSLPLFGGDVEAWQLPINTFTTVVTFLLVALLHNTQHRFEKAQNERWERLLAGLRLDDPVEDEGQKP